MGQWGGVNVSHLSGKVHVVGTCEYGNESLQFIKPTNAHIISH